MEELCEKWLQAVAELDAGLMVSREWGMMVG